MNQKDYWEREELQSRRSPEHPAVAAYVLQKIRAVQHCVRLTPQTRVLDVGCGNGFFTFYLDKICDAYGVDYSEKMLQLNPLKKTFLMDASDLLFEDNSFDVVICHSLLHHVEHVETVVREMTRVSRKHIVILEPNRNNPFMFLYALAVREEWKALRFSLSYLENIVKRNHLHIVTSFSCGMAFPNRTPKFLLALPGLFNLNHPLGITNVLIAEKAA
jgi:SAM-dependent methyltransferase